MPEPKILDSFVPKENHNKESYVKERTEEIRNYFSNKLNEAFSLKDRIFQSICMFAIIDSLAQEYADYPTRNSKDVFCNFVLKFQNQYDFFEMVEPITLFYHYEPNIKKVIKYEELNRIDPKQFPPELEVDLKDIQHLDKKSVEAVIKTDMANKILQLIEKQKGAETKERYIKKHQFISLLYKMRSKTVHELSHLGGETKWDVDDNHSLPFYRNIGRIYVKDDFLVNDNVYELVIPNKFIYNLALNCINNYLDYCVCQNRLPFENNSNCKRNVSITWND